MNDTLLVSTFESVNTTSLESRIDASLESLDLTDNLLNGATSITSMVISLVDGVSYDEWLSSQIDDIITTIDGDDKTIFGIKQIYVIIGAAALMFMLTIVLICMCFVGHCKCCECRKRKTEYQKRAHATYVSFFSFHVCVCARGI